MSSLRAQTAPPSLSFPPRAGFARLVEIMARLRSPGGCPWDREQTFDTIKPYLLEETYEVMDSIDARDWDGLADELGDLLLQVVFFSQMAKEAGHFDVTDAIEAINSKLVRRHPHVFAEGEAKTAEDVVRKWDEIKATEKAPKPKGLLAGVPRSLPALMEARQIAGRAAGAGFDWNNVDEVLEKLREELAELDGAREGRIAGSPSRRNRRPAVRDREHRAVSESGPGAGAARDQLQVSPPLRTRRKRPGGAGQVAEGSYHRRNGSALAGGQTARG